MDIRLQVKKYIREEDLIRPGDHVIAGLSGGADSVCLLLVLAELAGELGFTLSAVHVNHGIRGGEAFRDEEFCRNLCGEQEIPLTVYRRDVPAEARRTGRSLEEAGRMVRYSCLKEAAARCQTGEGGVKIALAHHLDDQAETVLMNLCRGTGIRGLGGIPPKRDSFIRPLLGCRRSGIEEWLRERGIRWREDSTNASEDYTRNRLRHQALPWLAANVNAGTAGHLAGFAEQARELDAYLDTEAERWLSRNAEESGLPAEKLMKLPAALSGRILHRVISRAEGGSRDVTRRHILAVRGLLSGPDGARIDLPGGVTARRIQGRLVLEAETEESPEAAVPAEQTDLVEAVFARFPRPEGEKIPDKRYTKWFDYDRITGDIVFRTRKTGDRLVLAGVGTKSVKSYMIDAKIPAGERDSIPLLAMGQRVLWIVGYRMSAEFQITEETKTVLQVTVRSVKGENCRE